MDTVSSVSDLPEGIIDVCLKRLACAEDFFRSSAVCQSWNSIVSTMIEGKKHQKDFAPWLMLTPPDDQDGDETPQKFYSFASGKMLSMNLSTLSRGKRCWGSSFGWILTIGLDANVHIFNPLTRAQLSLPSQTTFHNPHTKNNYKHPPSLLRRVSIHKLILSSDPYHSSVPVIAIHGDFGYLAIAQPGDQSWVPVTKPGTIACQDAIFFKGHFYVVTCRGDLLMCDLDSNCPNATKFVSPPEDSVLDNKFYLAEMSGDLHLIERAHTVIYSSMDDDLHYETDGFMVYKLDFHTKTWVTLKDFRDHALFLGNNNSFALSTTKYPQFKRNSIYFSHDHIDLLPLLPYDDSGIYDYANQEMVETDICVQNDVPTDYNRPFFFMPGL